MEQQKEEMNVYRLYKTPNVSIVLSTSNVGLVLASSVLLIREVSPYSFPWFLCGLWRLNLLCLA